jgi:hypothetical protein
MHYGRSADHDTSRETGTPGCVLEVSRLVGLQWEQGGVLLVKPIKVFGLIDKLQSQTAAGFQKKGKEV